MTINLTVAAGILALSLALPISANAQERNALETLHNLPLKTLSGDITVYFSPGYEERAQKLQGWYQEAITFYEGTLSQHFDADLAILNAKHWAAFTKNPYGLPHIRFDAPRPIAVLPATTDKGAMIAMFRRFKMGGPVEAGRLVGMIGFHEFGHAIVEQCLYQPAGVTKPSVLWFHEFLATYFGLGYLWHTDNPLVNAMAKPSEDYLPPHSSLIEFGDPAIRRGFFRTQAGFVNYNWYEYRIAERAKAVFDKQGMGFIERVRTELPWDRQDEWTSENLLTWLEKIEPGFVAWAASLEEQ